MAWRNELKSPGWGEVAGSVSVPGAGAVSAFGLGV